MKLAMLNILLMLNMGMTPAMPIDGLYQCACNDCMALHQEIEEEVEEEFAEEEPQYNVISLPSNNNNSFKTYMDYRAITNRSSKQWKLQQEAYTGEHGIRMIDEYYCVALGSAFSNKIGAKFEITLKDGQTFKAILADQKSDLHTDATNKYMKLANGKINIIEFVVETEKLESLPRAMGDISHTSNGMFDGEIVEIKEILDETDSSN